MAAKVADSLHSKIDFRSFYPQGEDCDDERKVCCFNPKHQDRKPSMSINLTTGQYYCHGCGEKGNAITYARDYLQMDYETLAKEHGLIKFIEPERVRRYHEALLRNEKLLKFLTEERGLTMEVIKRFALGVDGERITIPIAEEGELVNVRRYLPHAKDAADKMRNEPGFGAARLWPQTELDGDEVVVCEGELDCLVLISNGLRAVTGTGGAKTWKREWAPLFSGRDVAVCYDIDVPGQDGALAVIQGLKPFAKRVRNIVLPLDPEDFPAGDVTDYFVKQNYSAVDFRNLMRVAPIVAAKEEKDNVASASIPIFDVTLAQAAKPQYYNQHIIADVIVSAKDTAPYHIPKLVEFRCGMGLKICSVCPVNEQEGSMTVELPPESPTLLNLINRGADQVHGAMKRFAGVPKMCSAHEMIVKEAHSVEEVRLVPQFHEALSPDKRSEYVVRRSFYVGYGIETNAPFRIQALTLPEPNTQYATHLIYQATPAMDSLSDFHLKEGEFDALKELFGAKHAKRKAITAADINTAIKARYDDLEANVTHIWGRRLHHFIVDVCVHSPLYLKLGGDLFKGYVEALLLGDSGQGKSAITGTLQRHYGLGERVDVGAATVAGLKGGLQETQKRWWVTWGIIPQNDRRWVILEEVKNAEEEILAKLRDMRSSGIAEVAGIERQRTNARTRLLWVSNPRGYRQLSTYDYGVQAVRELMGNLEDVRRFDIAACLASGDVDLALINRPERGWPKAPAERTAALCRKLVLWAWSRKADQCDLSSCEQALLDAAGVLGRKYHPAIPLVEPADQRLKVARIAAAVAALTFSTPDGERLEILPSHVEIATTLLDTCYSAPSMAYDQFSAQMYQDAQLLDKDQIFATIRTCPHGWDLVQGLLMTDYLSKTDIAEYSGLPEKDALNEFVGLLVRKRALKKYNTKYRKTPAFIEWLRTLTPNKFDARRPAGSAPSTPDTFMY